MILMIWLQQLEEKIASKMSRENILGDMYLLHGAAAFLADTSADSMRLTARAAGLSNAARRALWLKGCPGDLQSKAKLCSLPCDGQFLFGKNLDEILEKAGDKKGFPRFQGDQRRPPFRRGKFNRGRPLGDRKRKSLDSCSGEPLHPQKSPLNDAGIPVGGRLMLFGQAWENISSNTWILNIIKEGLKFPFFQQPRASFVVTPVRKGVEEQLALEAEILSLLDKHVLIEVPRGQERRGFYSPLFLIKKPDHSFRTIINLRGLNRWIQNQTFKMESVTSAIRLLHHNCFMAVVDLKDAYYHIPIHSEYQKYLRVALYIRGNLKHFQFRALPFGISIAPRVFTKVVAEMTAFLRIHNTIIIPYLDDFLIVGNSERHCTEQVERVIDTLRNLGWMVNVKKSRLQPLQRQMFLGFILDSNQQICLLPDAKVEKVRDMILATIDQPHTTLRGAMSLLGTLTACIPAVRWAQFHTHQLQAEVLSAQKSLKGCLEGRLELSVKTKGSLRWWLDRANLLTGTSWQKPVSDVIMTDASSSGWGAHLRGQVAQGPWGHLEQNASSNLRELRAVNRALRIFMPTLEGRNVRIMLDNSTTVAYINHQGGTRSRSLMLETNEIFHRAERHLQPLHIRGVENTQADFLSRNTLKQGEWTLNRVVFQKIVHLWGEPIIDLFANRSNRQVKSFCSLNPKEEPWAVDALQIPWDFKLSYAFPPVALIPVVVKKIREDHARVILIAPFWPKRPWFSLLQIMSLSDPWVLPEIPDLLAQGPVFHTQFKGFHLTAWNLKGHF
ncbi:uncharacterized protein [Dendrobates tinctorius]|uniref:uncharacterized protein n=1 Tax=Dendrobates tinctorius TaxID=92724 RepID=UPI003CC95F1E